MVSEIWAILTFLFGFLLIVTIVLGRMQAYQLRDKDREIDRLNLANNIKRKEAVDLTHKVRMLEKRGPSIRAIRLKP
jgi:hypothetical protein